MWGTRTPTGSWSPSRYWSPEDWAGDPLRFLDKWLEAIREWQDEVDAQYRADGTKYDTSHLTKQAEAHEKVSGLVKAMLELC